MLRELKAEKDWGITKVADESKVARSTITLWRDADWSKGIPSRPVVEKFCDNLKLKKAEPFACMGWLLEPREVAVEAKDKALFEVPPESDADRQIRLIRVRLDQKPAADERRRLERLLVRALRTRDEQRLMDEELAELLGEDAPEPSESE